MWTICKLELMNGPVADGWSIKKKNQIVTYINSGNDYYFFQIVI